MQNADKTVPVSVKDYYRYVRKLNMFCLYQTHLRSEGNLTK